MFPWLSHPGQDMTGITVSMLLHMVAKDCLCTSYGKVTVSDTNQNTSRECSVGFTSGIGCMVQKSGSLAGIATHIVIKGSRRYPHLWKGMNELLEFICSTTDIPCPFQDKNRSTNQSQTIFWFNLFESLSIYTYLYEFNCVKC